MLRYAERSAKLNRLVGRLIPRGHFLVILILISSLLLSACGSLPNSSANISSLTAANNPLVVTDVFPTKPLQGAATSYSLGVNLGQGNTIKQGQMLQVTLQGNNPGDIAWAAGNLPHLTFGSTSLDLLPISESDLFNSSPVFAAYLPIGVELAAQTYPLVISLTDETGATRQLRQMVQVEKQNFSFQDLTLEGDLTSLADHRADDFDNAQLAATYRTFSPVQQWQGDWQLPLNVAWTLTTAFGEQRTYNGQADTLYYHEGADMGPLSAKDGDLVLAPATGTVVYVGDLEARGQTVAIDHGLGVTSYYFHLSGISVEPGQTVEAGQALGLVGSTGRATGPHLHWEVRTQGTPVDPFAFLSQL